MDGGSGGPAKEVEPHLLPQQQRANDPMDRKSVLGDTIEYMKEPLGRIEQLQGKMEEQQQDAGTTAVAGAVLQSLNEVELSKVGPCMYMYCSAKTGLLLSRVNTLERSASTSSSAPSASSTALPCTPPGPG